MSKKLSVNIVTKKAQKDPEILKQVVANLSSAVNILEYIGSENIAYRKTIEKIISDWDKWIEE